MQREYDVASSDFLIFLYTDTTNIAIRPLGNDKQIHTYSLKERLLNEENYFQMMTSPLFQAMKRETVEQNIFELTTGYLTQDKTFYRTPIKIGNVVLSSLRVSREQKGHLSEINFSVDVYDKYYNKRTITIDDEIEDIIEVIETIIKRLNIAVSQGYHVKYLNESFINLLYRSEVFFEADLKSIEYRLFENSGTNRPGKDNTFWYEIEIKNLPKSRYLVFLIRESLSLDNSIDSLDDNSIVIRTNFHDAFSRAIERTEISDDHTLDLTKKRIDEYVSANCNHQSKRLSFLFFRDRIFYARQKFRINSFEIEKEMLIIINGLSVPFDRYELIGDRKLTDLRITSVGVKDHPFDRFIHVLSGKADVSFGTSFEISSDYILSFELIYNFKLREIIYIHNLEIDDWAKDYDGTNEL
jgi:hypothetical protein